MYFICNKDPSHIHENASLFLAATCAQFTGQCNGILIASSRYIEEYGISNEEVKRINETPTAMGVPLMNRIVGIPLRKMDAEDSKGKKGVWIGIRENGRRRVYFRCLSCLALNTIDSHVPENIDYEGNVSKCEICHQCQIHQFIRLVGWADYLSEGGPLKKRRNQ